MEKLVLPLLIFLSLYSQTSAYFITVDAHAEECFFERVEVGTKMSLTFEIAEGGFLDIDVRLVGPDGKVRVSREAKSHGTDLIAADMAGEYTYCFSNQKSTLTPKIVMFNMVLGPPAKPVEHEAGKEGHEGTEGSASLESMINDLSWSLAGVKSEQEYMQVRDRNHRAINESTNFYVVLWSIFEATVLFTMTLGQVFYLKRFFEVRRVV